MCRMMGVIGQPPLPAKQVMNSFYALCESGRAACGDKPGHGDGWGLSGYSGGRAVYFARSVHSAAKDRSLYEDAITRASKSKSPVLISHFRKASAGSVDIGNTHPFHYRDWVFAHNGTLFNAISTLSIETTQPQGQTDSERMGLWLLEKMVPALDPTATLIEALEIIREKTSYSSLSFLLTNGHTLWAYREFTDQQLEAGETLDDRDGYFSLVWTSVEKLFVVCSEPLPDLGHVWKSLPNRTLAIFTPGTDAPKIQTL